MISLSQAQINAAQAFANAAISELGTERGVHAETAVASVAFGVALYGFIEGARTAPAPVVH